MSSNLELQTRRIAAAPRGVGNATAVYADRAENAEVWDVEGRRYIDFAAGIAVLNTGHRHPKVMRAVADQLGRFTHTAFQVLPYEPYVELAERLNALAPFSQPAQTLLVTTGAEAVENAVKIARSATGRPGVIAFTGGFHGRTLLTMGLTGKVAPYKAGLGLSPAGVFHAPFPNPRYGVSVEQSLQALRFLFTADIAPSEVAAIIIEPVQGEGGFNPAPAEFLQALRKICDEHGILLIADEVQTGFARTGRMFGIELSGVEPDLLTVGKALAGGFPLAGVVGRADIMSRVEPGGLGGTYGGFPVACAAALAVLDVIEEEDLRGRAEAMGRQMQARIAGWASQNDFPAISQPRGPGAMVAFDFLQTRGAPEPDGARAKQFAAEALSRGLIILTCGSFGETVRMLAPLTAAPELLDEGLDIAEAAIAAVR